MEFQTLWCYIILVRKQSYLNDETLYRKKGGALFRESVTKLHTREGPTKAVLLNNSFPFWTFYSLYIGKIEMSCHMEEGKGA